MSTLQDSLYGPDCGVALPSQEDTALHHTRSPRCSGSLLRGSLAITTTGLPPVSHQNLSRHTSALFDRSHPVFRSSSLTIRRIVAASTGSRDWPRYSRNASLIIVW